MTAHLTDELAQSLADGLLPAVEAAECRAHVARCDDCRLLVESYAALAEALEDLAPPPPPVDFTARVMAAVEAREHARAWERRLATGIVAVAACAAFVLLGLSGASGWAPALSRAGDALGEAARALALGSEIVSPLIRLLRVQILAACVAAGLPLLFALSRLVPRRVEVPA
jgi:anti-sigma factor RsiW